MKGARTTALGTAEALEKHFPKTYGQPFVDVVPAPGKKITATPQGAPAAVVRAPSTLATTKTLRIGCVLSGGQAACLRVPGVEETCLRVQGVGAAGRRVEQESRARWAAQHRTQRRLWTSIAPAI